MPPKILSAMFIMVAAFSFSPRAQGAEEAAPPTEIQKTIDLLEDETKRGEVVRLLKLMAALEEEAAGGADAAAETLAEPSSAAAQEAHGLMGRIQGRLKGAGRAAAAFWPGLKQSLAYFGDVITALDAPVSLAIWRPYVLKILAWGLLCLLAALAAVKKFGQTTDFEPGPAGRLKAVVKHLLIVAAPNLLLALSLMALPGLSTTGPGITADMATGLAFVHSAAFNFFVTLSILYIFLRLVTVVFAPNDQGRIIANLHPVLAKHFLHSAKVVAAYMALFIFAKEVFLEHFAAPALYSLSLVIMTLPVPVYLTARILKLRKILKTIGEAEATAETDEGQEAEGPARLDYRADAFIHRHWWIIALAFVWLMSLISIFNPADATERFVGRLAGTLVIALLGGATIALERRLTARLIKGDTENGRHLLLVTDTLANIVVWLGALAMLVSLWGMPLGNLLDNPLTREILARGLAIAITCVALGVFLRFSRLIAAWLANSPEMSESRNLRTMLPLFLTAARALAIFITVVVILERLGVNVGPILAGAGILSLGVGMGAQTLVKDVINGISILMMNTISVGDYVTMGGQSGTVEFLGLRTARLRDPSGNLIIVPNSSVASIVNMTRDYSQELIELPAPYDADPDEMLKLANEVAADLSADPAWKKLMTKPVEVVGITGFNPNVTTIRLKVNAQAGQQWAVGRELRLRLKRRTLNEGLKSPWFGQNVFLYKGDDNYNAHRSTEEGAAGPPKNSDAPLKDSE